MNLKRVLKGFQPRNYKRTFVFCSILAGLKYGNGYYASNPYFKMAKSHLFSTRTTAEPDMDIDDNVFPEFEIDLSAKPEYVRNKYDWKINSRDFHIKQMSNPESVYDIVIIGGG